MNYTALPSAAEPGFSDATSFQAGDSGSEGYFSASEGPRFSQGSAPLWARF